MKRQRREGELRLRLTSRRGKEELLSLLERRMNLEECDLLPAEALGVEIILRYEHEPADASDRQPWENSGYESEEMDLVDVKFSEPAAMESLGG